MSVKRKTPRYGAKLRTTQVKYFICSASWEFLHSSCLLSPTFLLSSILLCLFYWSSSTSRFLLLFISLPLFYFFCIYDLLSTAQSLRKYFTLMPICVKVAKPVLFIVLTDSFFVITVLGRNVLPCRK